jgi:BMFP domain-containing protein YqiC
VPLRKPLFGNASFQARDDAAHRLCIDLGPRTNTVHDSGQPENGIEMNEKVLSDLSERLAELASANPAQDLRRNIRAMLSSAFTKLDLVSREEYDVQVEVLAKAREKLAALEARVAELEGRAKS